MRLLFVGKNDPYGYMASLSKAINQYSDMVSNCVVYSDQIGYDSDIVIKKSGDTMRVSDKMALVNDFAEETDIIILGVDSDGFDWPNKKWSTIIMKTKSRFIFLCDRDLHIPLSAIIKFSQEYQGMFRFITNQPYIQNALSSFGVECIFVPAIMPHRDHFNHCNTRIQLGCYETETPVSKDEFLAIGGYLYSEFSDFEYEFYGNPLGETRWASSHMSFSSFLPDRLAYSDILAVSYGMVSMNNLSQCEVSVLSELMGFDLSLSFVGVPDVKSLYDRVKESMLDFKHSGEKLSIAMRQAEEACKRWNNQIIVNNLLEKL